MTTATADKKTTPKVSKTKLARDTVIAVLTKANAPMEMSEIISKVQSVKAVKDAEIPRGTISAQINFELGEKTPRIVRLGRGVYGAKGVKLPKATATPAGKSSTPKAKDEETAPAPAEDTPVEAAPESEQAAPEAPAAPESKDVTPDPKVK